jgi:hypothetical protein
MDHVINDKEREVVGVFVRFRATSTTFNVFFEGL